MILEFIKTYWREILDVVAFVGALVLFIVKKKPVKVVDGVKDQILQALPYCINHVEKFGPDFKGKDKLNACVYLVRDLLDFDDFEFDRYVPFIEEQIENILSTPQKKGENYGKKNQKS